MTTSDVQFWKHIPINIEISQRLAFEGIGLACELIDAEASLFKDVMSNGVIEGDEYKLTEAQRIALFRSVWSMIDATDILRKLMHDQARAIAFGLMKEEKEMLSTAQAMRNSMDHPIGTIRRLAKAKTSTPLYGLMTASWHKDSDLKWNDDVLTIDGRRAFVISIASTHHKFELKNEDIFDNGLYSKWGNPRLHVGKETLKIPVMWELSNRLRDVFTKLFSDIKDLNLIDKPEPLSLNNGPLAHSISTQFNYPRRFRIIDGKLQQIDD